MAVMKDLLLDGSFATPTCLQLAVAGYFKVVGFGLLMTTVYVTVICVYGLFLAPAGFRWDIEAAKADPKTKTMLIAGGVSLVATIALLAVVAPLSHQRIRLVATPSSFVETGCYLGSIYEAILDRPQTTITYTFAGGKMLLFSQKGQRRLTVAIDGNPNASNLVEIAPGAMHKYFNNLRTTEQNR
jgi:hypothetical protein